MWAYGPSLLRISIAPVRPISKCCDLAISVLVASWLLLRAYRVPKRNPGSMHFFTLFSLSPCIPSLLIPFTMSINISLDILYAHSYEYSPSLVLTGVIDNNTVILELVKGAGSKKVRRFSELAAITRTNFELSTWRSRINPALLAKSRTEISPFAYMPLKKHRTCPKIAFHC